MFQRFLSIFICSASLLIGGGALAQVKFGIGVAMTGPTAAFGLQLKTGAEQAIADLNAKGGLLGQKIEITLGDDRGDPKDGVSVANKFIGENVKFVVGHFNSGVAIPASKEYTEGGVLFVAPGSTNPRLTDEGGWNVFRVCGRDDQQGEVAGNYIVTHFKNKKIAVIHDKTAYGKGIAEVTRKTINAGGVKEVLFDGINPGEKDYSALISRLKQLDVDYVYFGGYHPEAGLIIRQMKDQGVKAVMIAGDGIATDEFASIAGPEGAGTFMTFGRNPLKNPEADSIVKRFVAKRIQPEGYVLYSYAAVQVIAQAAEAADSLDPRKVAEVMHSGRSFNTVFGPLSFDKKGDITKSAFVMYQWKKDASGKLTYEEVADKTE